jgi:EF hand
MRLNPVLAALDADHDGEISADEIKNSAAALRTLGKTHDGSLTPDELLPDPLTIKRR